MDFRFLGKCAKKKNAKHAKLIFCDLCVFPGGLREIIALFAVYFPICKFHLKPRQGEGHLFEVVPLPQETNRTYICSLIFLQLQLKYILFHLKLSTCLLYTSPSPR